MVLKQSRQLRKLTQYLSKANWRFPFSIRADTDLPSGFPLKAIKRWLRYELQKIEAEQLERSIGYLKIQNEVLPLVQEGFPIKYQGKYPGSEYAITFTILPPNSRDAGGRILRPELLPPITDVVERSADKIAEKSRKYGDLDRPFVIAVWCRMSVYGLDPSNILSGFPGHRNGFFLKTLEEKLRYSRVSAVVFYHYGHDSRENMHDFEVYHNPYAERPLPKKIFSGHDQWEYFENSKGYGWQTLGD
jgi:hypothetical protein